MSDYYHDRSLLRGKERRRRYDPLCHWEAYSQYSYESDNLPFYNVYHENAAIKRSGPVEPRNDNSLEPFIPTDGDEEPDLDLLHTAIGLLSVLVLDGDDRMHIIL
jgi:hypothetical protein